MYEILNIVGIIILSLGLTGCFFESEDVDWEFPIDQYESPNYYTIVYGTEYGSIEFQRIIEESIVDRNHYFDGFYVIESNPDIYYVKEEGILYEISIIEDGYTCTILTEYDEHVHVDISTFEDDLLNSTYQTRGKFPFRFTRTIGEHDPYIEFHSETFPTIEFDYHQTNEPYYYTVIFHTSSQYDSIEFDFDCLDE